MASAPAPTPRASLLAGLRTGGVRPNPVTGVPHTAAPGISFNIPSRFTSATYNQQSFGEEEDQLSDMFSHNMYINPQQRVYQAPNTAAVDGGANRFSQQQVHFANGLMSGMPYSNPAAGNAQLQAQQQALQMQLMQLELIRMQVRSLSPPDPFLVVDLPFRPCKPSSCKPSYLPRVASRAVDYSCLLLLQAPQHSHLINIRPL
jgi:hypothetical protein